MYKKLFKNTTKTTTTTITTTGTIYCHRMNSCTRNSLTLYLLTWKIWWARNNASKGQTRFNSAFKGLNLLWDIPPPLPPKKRCDLRGVSYMGCDINWTIKHRFEITNWMQLAQDSSRTILDNFLRLGYLNSRKCSPSLSLLIFIKGPSIVEMGS
jgi:hypothetical protein